MNLAECVEIEGESVESRLVQLGLTLDGLLEAVRAVGLAHALAVVNHPATHGGSNAYGEATRIVREKFAPLGWEKLTFRGSELTKSPDGSMVIRARSGNAKVGLKGSVGQAAGPKYPVSKSTAAMVNDPRFIAESQLSLFREGDDEPAESPPDVKTYWFLTCIDRETIRSELSYAVRVEDGVLLFRERILLPEVSLADEPLVGAEDVESPDADILVTEKS